MSTHPQTHRTILRITAVCQINKNLIAINDGANSGRTRAASLYDVVICMSFGLRGGCCLTAFEPTCIPPRSCSVDKKIQLLWACHGLRSQKWKLKSCSFVAKMHHNVYQNACIRPYLSKIFPRHVAYLAGLKAGCVHNVLIPGPMSRSYRNYDGVNSERNMS